MVRKRWLVRLRTLCVVLGDGDCDRRCVTLCTRLFRPTVQEETRMVTDVRTPLHGSSQHKGMEKGKF
jgi:hypothetical protein